MESQSRIIALAVTNLIKLAGLVIALEEIFGRARPDTISMAVAAFMMAGAQLSEDVILNLVSKMFTAPSPEPPADPPHAEVPASKPRPKMPSGNRGRRK